MINRKSVLFFLTLAVCTFGINFLQAQDLPTEQVDVIKSFDARLLDAERLNITPKLPALDTATRNQTYRIESRSLNVEYLPPKIRPLAMRGDALKQNYNGYTKIGAGFPRSFFIDGSYDIVTDENMDLGLNLFHHSTKSNNVENQRFSYSNVLADGTYYFDQGYAVNGKLGYTVDNIFYYGYNAFNEAADSTIFSFDKADVKQSFTTFDASGSIFNGERTVADFNYDAGFDFYFMEDNFAARETGFAINLKATKWFSDAHPLTVELISDFTAYRDTARQTLNNFFLKPSYTYHSNIFTAKLGANIASSDDEFSFFPDVELNAQVVGSILTAFVGAEGSLQKNNLNSLADYNPFINTRLDIRNTLYYNYYGGIKGNFQGIDYRAQVGYKTTENLPLYLSTGDSIPRFNVLYDTANIVSLKASVIAPLFEGFELTGTLTQNFYTLDNQEKPWHLPAFTLNVGASYTTLEDKSLTLRGEFYLENGVPFLNDAGESENLNALFDISVGADYAISETIGFFGQINNLANNKRERWRNYPVLGTNFLAGLTAKF